MLARPPRAPAPARTTTTTTPTRLAVLADDGHPVPVRVYEPAGPARATVLVTAGTAIRQSYYARFASYLGRHDLRTVTFDYRGIGDARPASLRGFEASMRDWALLDTRAVLAWVQAQRGRAPVLLVAHSFGAQMIGLVDELAGVDGAVMVGAQLGYVGHWPTLARARIELLFRAGVPLLTRTLGYMPGIGLGGVDLPGGVAREWARWCRSPEYLISHHEDARARFARFDRPTLFYSFTDDVGFAPEPAVEAFLASLSGAPVVHRRLAPRDVGVRSVGHFGFFRQAHEGSLWAEARDYLHDLAAGRPPRARARRPGALFELTAEEIAQDLGTLLG
jgi:predicted alpha/beta hydrolase